MKAKLLIEHFDRLVEAPDAISRLRRFVLDLAVRGKLVDQREKDGSTLDLLTQIDAEKANLISTDRQKKEKSFSPVNPKEIPFPVPASWTWVRLQDITSYIQRGKSPKYSTAAGLPVVSQKCVQWRGLDLSAARFITKESIKEYEEVRFLRENDLLWNSTGTGTIGRIVRLKAPPKNLVCDSHVTVVRCMLVNPEYVRTWLASDQVYRTIEDRAAGATSQVELNLTMAALQVVPLPPLAEQRRIVAQVEKLMKLCDQFEAAQNERKSRRDLLVTSCTQKLTQIGATDSSKAQLGYTSFLLEHFPHFSTCLEHIKSVRQIILNYAVSGALSENKDWTLVPRPLRTAATLQNGYAFKSEWFTKTGVRLLRNKNVSHNSIKWDDVVCVSAERAKDFERFELIEGDVILSLDRPFISTGTKVARLLGADIPSLLLQRVGRFQLNKKLLTPEFLLLWIESPHFSKQVDPGRSNGVPHISSKQVEAAEIYLPSISEQRRIVAKVNKLMLICDQLEFSLGVIENDSLRFLSNIIEDILGAKRKQFLNKASHKIENPDTILDLKPESRFMTASPISTVAQLLECVDYLGGLTTPEHLLMQTGLSDDIEAFYDLIRAARDDGGLTAPLGSGEDIRRIVDAN
ncbi:restriction endonuclease subunit S [Acidovorax sp. FG27]|uniref:restriction endonuclease subunit S n=1 Tax=Acidovorax sp. FG27 TaxID=3133652 RepID=UPI0030E83AC4